MAKKKIAIKCPQEGGKYGQCGAFLTEITFDEHKVDTATDLSVLLVCRRCSSRVTIDLKTFINPHKG